MSLNPKPVKPRVSRYDSRPDLAEKLNELDRAIGVRDFAWAAGSKVFVNIELSSSFEPHGRASEMWEPTWMLTLVGIHYHWRTNQDDWAEGNEKAGDIRFHGMNLSSCVDQALRFLREPHLTRVEHEARLPIKLHHG
jgi:hypothetical protein